MDYFSRLAAPVFGQGFGGSSRAVTVLQMFRYPKRKWRQTMDNRLSYFARGVLTVSVVAPAGLVYSIAILIEGDILQAALVFLVVAIFGWTCIYIFDVLAGFKKGNFLGRNLKVPAAEPFEFQNVDAVDRDNIAVLFFYLAPLLRSGLDGLDLKFLFLLIVFFSFIALTTGSYFFNPLLGMLGWRFYRVKFPDLVSRIIISKGPITRGGVKIAGVQLTDDIILMCSDDACEEESDDAYSAVH